MKTTVIKAVRLCSVCDTVNVCGMGSVALAVLFKSLEDLVPGAFFLCPFLLPRDEAHLGGTDCPERLVHTWLVT